MVKKMKIVKTTKIGFKEAFRKKQEMEKKVGEDGLDDDNVGHEGSWNAAI